MSLIERVKAEVQNIIDEELTTLVKVEGRVAQSVQVTSKRIKDLIQSYSDLEKSLGTMVNLGLMGLTSETAKVMDWEREKQRMQQWSIDNGFQLSISGSILFQEHPAGSAFKPDPKKKYKLLVAFIPVEESG